MWSSCMVFLDTLLLHYLTIDSQKSRGGCKKRQTNVKRRSQCGQFYSNTVCSNCSSSMAINSQDIFEVSVFISNTNEDPVSYPGVDYCFTFFHTLSRFSQLTEAIYTSAKVFLLLQPRIQFHFAPCVTFI